MQTQVFDPLGMKSTTFDYARAVARQPCRPACAGRRRQAGARGDGAELLDHPAAARGRGVEQHSGHAAVRVDGARRREAARRKDLHLEASSLLDRRAPQVAIGKDETYGMGLMVDTEYGIPVVHHGGDMVGYHSDMIWLPDQNVGAVILTNGDPGWLLRSQFRRKLLEVLFDGKPEADDPGGRGRQDLLRSDRRGAEAPDRAGGRCREREARVPIRERGPRRDRGEPGERCDDLRLRRMEERGRVASRNPDGTISFITTAPGHLGLRVRGRRGARRGRS